MDRALGIVAVPLVVCLVLPTLAPVRGPGDAGARLAIDDPRLANANGLLGRLRLARIRNTLEGFGSYASQAIHSP